MYRGPTSRRETQPSVLHADEGAATDDDVIEQIDVHHFGGLFDLPGNHDVRAAGRGIARRVIVHHYDGRTVLPDGGAENFGYANRRRVYGALVNLVGADNFGVG